MKKKEKGRRRFISDFALGTFSSKGAASLIPGYSWNSGKSTVVGTTPTPTNRLV